MNMIQKAPSSHLDPWMACSTNPTSCRLCGLLIDLFWWRAGASRSIYLPLMRWAGRRASDIDSWHSCMFPPAPASVHPLGEVQAIYNDQHVLIYSADPRYALTAETMVSTRGNKGTYNRSQGLTVTIPHVALCAGAAISVKWLMSKNRCRHK